MIKNVFFALLQFVLFFLVFGAGSFFPPFSLEQKLSNYARWDAGFRMGWRLLMVLVFAVILLIEALRKRIRTAGPWTTLALILATTAGLAEVWLPDRRNSSLSIGPDDAPVPR